VKAPGFGDRRKELLQDVCVVTGATFVSEEVGRKLDSVEVTDLGHAHRVVATKDATTIVGGNGAKAEIEKRVAQIKAQLKKTDSDFDKEKLQERLGKLSGGVAVIKVGAPTESAQKELKQRVEDAVAATRAAMEEGIVPGGGMALFNTTVDVVGTASKEVKTEAEAAKMIIQKALQAPIAAIISNSGESVDAIIQKLSAEKAKAGNNHWLGFNAITNQIDDLKKAGIIDPLKVTKTAFLNAISVAANYLTIGVALTEKPEPKTPPAGGGMPGMGGMDY